MIYFLIAGEASGDLHGAQLMAAIKQRDAKARFVFLGGDLMAEQAGHEPVIHYREMAYMGFSEVLRNLGTISHNLKKTKAALRLAHPDRLILIDYPSFNLKIAKEAKRYGIDVTYYISPKVWAWKEWRVRTIKQVVDRVLVIFPFEVDFYKSRHDYDVTYIGNPSVEEIDARLASLPPREEFIKTHNLPTRQLIALLPGSRLGEIRNNLPIMLKAADDFPQYRPVIAAAPGVDDEFYRSIAGNATVLRDNTITLLAYSRGALVTSGTATLEAALIGTPQVACYRANGNKISYKIMEKLLKVDYVTLPNLIAEREVIPELLVHNCTVEAVSDALGLILPDNNARQKMLDGYREIRHRLGTLKAATTAAEIICRR
ncbi:MAG: lipid-A-disaccharide synthase [Muribaculaceae bacterium]|nr:lipid-A-disaccharide synthase [Muribaculaceae bacterium]